MIKSEVIAHIASRPKYRDMPEADVAEHVNNLLDLLSDTLCHNGRVEVRGFGSFCNHKRKARNAHNPKTGDKVVTKEKFTPHFKPGKLLRERVDEVRLTTPLKRDLETDHGAAGEGEPLY